MPRNSIRVALLVCVVATPVVGQSATGIPLARPSADTMPHRPPPLNYFFRSLLIPGWGQASLDRKLTGGLFVAFEGLAWSMTLKTNTELRYLDLADSTTAVSRRTDRQDWVALIIFNHLFSALEAYVSAHLLDFPPDLRIRPLPGGRTGFGVTFKLPH